MHRLLQTEAKKSKIKARKKKNVKSTALGRELESSQQRELRPADVCMPNCSSPGRDFTQEAGETSGDVWGYVFI